MSDVMPPMGGEGKGALDNFKKNRSLVNPVDSTMMMQDGTISPDMTIAEFFQNTMGLDVNTNTVTDMVKATKKNVGNANPLEKMKNLAGGPGMGQPPAQAPPGGMPQAPQGGGLEDLIGSMR